MEKKLDITQSLNLAVEKQKEGKLYEAEFIYKKILEKDPNNSNALHLLGLIAYQSRNYEKAINLIKQAIQLKPHIAIYYGNLGMVYDIMDKEEDSVKNFKKALEINPQYENSHLAYYNLGIYLANRGKLWEALECYNKAIEINKNFFDAHWNKSLILLILKKFEEGWKEYEYRFKKKNPTDSRIFNKPKWNGSYLKGKKILILSEQGFGDNIQFVRYIPLVKERGGYVILECKKELIKLFENFSGIDELTEKKDNTIPNVDFNFYIHLMSLPKIFNTNLNNLPNKVPYLNANPKTVEKFKNKFNTESFKIGIVWAGNPNQENAKNRSPTFKNFKI